MSNRQIHSSDKCPKCGHKSSDVQSPMELPFRIYTETRAKWLEEAAKQLTECQGDDSWVDWMYEGKRLSEEGQ